MTDPSTNGRASKDTYLRWRERLAEKHATRREPAEPSPAARSNRWDPELLFVTADTSDVDAPDAVAIDEVVDDEAEVHEAELHEADVHEAAAAQVDVDEAGEQTIDLRVVGAAPEPPIQRADRAPADGGDVRGARVVDLTPSIPRVATDSAPPRGDARKDRYDSVMARLEHAPPAVRPLVDDTSLADALRDLNERRLEGKITDEQFRAQKAELFGRSSRV